MDLFSFDRDFCSRGYRMIAGVDEAGRGPWAGPVVAAAVVFPPGAHIEGLDDSKKLTPSRRERIFEEILKTALGIGVEIVDHRTIDAINILQATYRAMRGALGKITFSLDGVLVDGWAIPGLPLRQRAIIGGDGISAAIAAASVVAKVTRDRIMVDYARQYPAYRFQLNKGYGTPEHREALCRHGPCPIHRRSFAPVRECIGRPKDGVA